MGWAGGCRSRDMHLISSPPTHAQQRLGFSGLRPPPLPASTGGSGCPGATCLTGSGRLRPVRQRNACGKPTLMAMPCYHAGQQRTRSAEFREHVATIRLPQSCVQRSWDLQHWFCNAGREACTPAPLTPPCNSIIQHQHPALLPTPRLTRTVSAPFPPFPSPAQPPYPSPPPPATLLNPSNRI